jgi:hypothetical protein
MLCSYCLPVLGWLILFCPILYVSLLYIIIPITFSVDMFFSLFHSVMNYGIIFWGNSSHNTQVFKMQKKAIRIIMGCGNRESCRILFEELHILPLMSQYMLSLLTFVSNNRERYFANFEIHNINTGTPITYTYLDTFVYLPERSLQFRY